MLVMMLAVVKMMISAVLVMLIVHFDENLEFGCRFGASNPDS